MKNNSTIKRMKRLEEDYSKIKVKCKCGHILTMPVYVDKLICNWCGKVVHNNSKVYFKYKIRKLRSEKNESNRFIK